MANKTYRSAQGKKIDVDMLRLRNEEVIAVGNMKVNARGDELGPGGVIIKTRNEAMDEYYKSNAIYTAESVADAERQRTQGEPAIEADAFTDLDVDIAEQDALMPEKIGRAHV